MVVSRGWMVNYINAALLAAVSCYCKAATIPNPPLMFATDYVKPSGSTVNVPAGGDLQGAIDNAKAGDTLVLQAGGSYKGQINLPNKSGSGWIYVQSSAYASLPSPGTRVSLTDAKSMARITGSADSSRAIVALPNAHHYRFVGVEVTPEPGSYVTELVQIGNGDTSSVTLANNIVFDRCYIHADPAVGGRRGVQMDGAYIAVIDSYVADFKEIGTDTQALWAANTTGPLKIVNNFLEAVSENVMFGGAPSLSADLVPADIEVRGNYFYKPTSLQTTKWGDAVKNLLEFKTGKRVLVTQNRFENSWAAAQTGWGMTISPRGENGASPWTVTEDIAITENVWLNVGQGIRVGGHDDSGPTLITARVLIKNNYINVTGAGGTDGRMFSTLAGPNDVTIDHNTGFVTGGVNQALNISDEQPKGASYSFTNNLVSMGQYGFSGSGAGEGLSALNAYFSSWLFTHNALIAGNAGLYPSGNFFPASIDQVGFTNYSGGDYRLKDSSPYKGAGTDGLDLGANMELLTQQMSATMTSSTVPTPTIAPTTSKQKAKPSPPTNLSVH